MRHARSSALLLALWACHRVSASAGDSGGPEQVALGAVGSAVSFSAPVAAARVRSGTTMVAGLLVSRGTVAVSDIGDDGLIRWTVDVLSGISGGPNVELHVFPARDGAAVVYRGRRGDRAVMEAVLVDAAGHLSGPAVDAGAAACATDDALVWVERPHGGSARVLGLPWGKSRSEELARVSPERDPALVCGNKTVFALGDGEQDTTIATWPVAQPRPRWVMRDRDFSDEEREHDTFVVGDTLGLVRVGQSGVVAVRDVGAEMSPWRHLGARLNEADDVVADEAGCDGPGAPSVHALHVEKRTGSEQSFELAPAPCDRELGPFWTGSIDKAFVVAWVERASVRAAAEPPIVGLAYRTITSAGLGELSRVSRPSDEMVDAGCDKDRCYAVALVRPRGAVEMLPEAVEVVAYP
jgi:hypothetical protein